MHRAEPAGGQADESACVARADGAIPRVDDARQFARDRALPPVAGAVVDVLRIGLVEASALRRDENRRVLRPVECVLVSYPAGR